ncbi:hypothetical protein JTE90_008691 [Oedothorax gibbosus]|uniref:Uncharacterized protein n=1 Tax=Oedothorax gibbosus TaxID=931172 RepID=A0AAV6V3C3_9ARAC|nr:hypothetical protein JTE90_008691 [Oedothorax gibbosus]
MVRGFEKTMQWRTNARNCKPILQQISKALSQAFLQKRKTKFCKLQSHFKEDKTINYNFTVLPEENSKAPQNFPFRKSNDPISSRGVQIIVLKECHKIPGSLECLIVLESVSDDGTLIIYLLAATNDWQSMAEGHKSIRWVDKNASNSVFLYNKRHANGKKVVPRIGPKMTSAGPIDRWTAMKALGGFSQGVAQGVVPFNPSSKNPSPKLSIKVICQVGTEKAN